MMHEYHQRVEKTFKAIEDNPGFDLKLLCAVLSLQLHVKPERVEEYVRTLVDANQVVADLGKVWTRQAYENWLEAKRRVEAMEEEERMKKAKVQVPLDAYDTEGER